MKLQAFRAIQHQISYLHFNTGILHAYMIIAKDIYQGLHLYFGYSVAHS